MNHKENPAEIYLVPDTEHGHIWSDDPAPGDGMREEDATRYVREDLVPASNEILARRVVELSETVTALSNQLAAKPSDSGYAKLQGAHDALKAQVKQLNNELRQQKLIHIGFTNEHQVTYVTEQDSEGTFYPDSDNGCYIPVYMLDIHAHRVGYESVIYCENMRMKQELRNVPALYAEVATKAVEQFANIVFDESLKKRKGLLPVLSLAKEFNEAQRTGKLPPLQQHVG